MKFIKSILYFFITLSIFGISGLILLYIQGYNQSFLFLNQLHFAAGDLIFPHLTHLADGLLLTTIVALFYIKKDRAWIISMAWGLLFMAFVVNIFKYNVFPEWARPPLVFDKLQIHYITLQNECCNTFPSGHSATAACMFSFFAFQWEKKRKLFGILAGIATVLLGYSRIYIGVHFLGDVLFGSLLGFLIAGLSMIFIYPRTSDFFSDISATKLKYFDTSLRLMTVFLVVVDLYRIYGIYAGKNYGF